MDKQMGGRCPVIRTVTDFLERPIKGKNSSNWVKIEKLYKQRQALKASLLLLLVQLADKLHLQHRQLNIAKTGFASGGIAGGIVSIVGFGLAPFTFGASLIVSIVGGGIMAASGAGGLSSFIAEKIIIKKLWKQVNTELQKQFQLEVKIWELIKSKFQGGGIIAGTGGVIMKGVKLADVMGDAGGVIGGAGTAAKTGAATAKTGTATAKTLVATLTSTAGKVFHYGGFAFTLFSMVIDIYTVVQTSKEIHKDSPCEAEQQLRALIKKLENEDQ